MPDDPPAPAKPDIFAAVSSSPAAQDLRRRLEAGGALSAGSVTGPAQPFVVALLRRWFPDRPVLVITEGVKALDTFHQDLATWLGGRKSDVRSRTPDAGVAGARDEAGAIPEIQTSSPAESDVRDLAPLIFPPWDILPHEPKLPHADVISERLEVLVALNTGRWVQGSGFRVQGSRAAVPAADAGSRTSPVVVTTVAAALQKTFPTGEFRQATRHLKRGDTINPLDLLEWLEEQGYEPETQVTGKGELSWRGGIVDVYPPASPWPVRLEFFGDTLESLRLFDPHTQLSRETVESIVISPAGELGVLKRRLGSTAGPGPAPAFATLLDHLSDDAFVVLCEPVALHEQAAQYAQQIPAGDPFFNSWDSLLAEVRGRGMTLVELSESPGTQPETEALNFSSLDPFRPITDRLPAPQVAELQRREFFQQIHRWLRQDQAVHIFCNNEGERQRFDEIWSEVDVGGGRPEAEDGQTKAKPGVAATAVPVEGLPFTVELGSLSRGFLCAPARLVVITDAEIFGRYKVQRPRRLKSPHAAAMRSAFEIDFTEFEPGDHVVHLQHGIGKFLGLETLPPTRTRASSRGTRNSDGGSECLVIEYAPSEGAVEPPKLYVPVTEAHLVSKYVGAGKARPPLNQLGGTRWTKAKDQAQRAVRDLAADLLSVQAARATQPGHAFSDDTAWQREFEGAFLYEETPDQSGAIEATKRDMEAAKPMDRLICGDVGFGKTEVAIRAAFKAVMGGRQVAVLVPTTVLAQQHYNTFRERMADYPVRIELLSRFRSGREQRQVVEALGSGAVDIVIGTHRLVQSDVLFKDLGLVVIDEEQKFGVAHKERFKRLRSTVDVLTLSATPIPRTLYLALAGARDMSTIETPPQDRLPVETIVTGYDERVIRDAIRRELVRGGQVFFLHNRVTTIEALALKLRALVPEARLVVGHGQMDADELEEVMARFVNGEADVLLCTTIIESGLDIPNANTIIIDRADRFGLSELYQLRGRVGRYKHQAFAYLLLPRHAQLLTEARKRMSAIKQFSSLGSGFKIAMRDLELRGAGNILGPQQSGHITAVGFELYCQLLSRSIAALKGEPARERREVQLSLDFLATSPEEIGNRKSRTGKAGETDSVEARNAKGSGTRLKIQVPRETPTYASDDDSPELPSLAPRPSPRAPPRSPAFLPLEYIREPGHRVEIYRRFAQAASRADLDALARELEDRFGPIPPPIERLLATHDLRLLAAARAVSSIEVVEGKVKFTRNGQLLTVGGYFPQLRKRDAKARLAELKKMLLSLG